KDPSFITMEEEIFGPVVTVYIYDDRAYESTLELCDQTSPYGLIGSIFANDRTAVALAEKKLSNTAGNFYINDKPSGAVVGQQPFGGSRASGTNDKAGSYLNLARWTTIRTIKENFSPPTDFRYSFMDAAYPYQQVARVEWCQVEDMPDMVRLEQENQFKAVFAAGVVFCYDP
ncbi:MAG: aldehyde dehydrogenase family protein, partial [Deltaproteobacteria bacterium]|nr:aldehyde dehydrogenase family protein [Deltaproteobacteria bacterium]